MKPVTTRIATPAGDILITVELVARQEKPGGQSAFGGTLISKGELARILDRSPAAVSNWISTGRISPAAIIGSGQRARLWVEQVERDLAAHPYPRPATALPYQPVARKTKECINCGRPFTGVGNRKLCSPECRDAWQRHSTRAWQQAHPEKVLENYRHAQSARARARTAMRLGKGET